MYCGFNFEDDFGFKTFLNFHPGQLALISTFFFTETQPIYRKPDENPPKHYFISC